MTGGRVSRRRRRGFTLLELLVVMGILVMLAVLTGIGVQQVLRESRLSAGVNQLVAALGNARAYAIKNNRDVMLAFRVVKDPARLSEPGRVELVLTESTGEIRNTGDTSGGEPVFAQRFVPVAGARGSILPRGIKVATPRTDVGQDTLYITQPDGTWIDNGSVVASSEWGRQLGVMFNGRGNLVTRTTRGPSVSANKLYPWVDFSRDGLQQRGREGVGSGYSNSNWNYNDLTDESNVNPCLMLMVFDDDEARSRYDVARWSGSFNPAFYDRHQDLTEFIDQFGVFLHFNRYSGVVEVEGG